MQKVFFSVLFLAISLLVVPSYGQVLPQPPPPALVESSGPILLEPPKPKRKAADKPRPPKKSVQSSNETSSSGSVSTAPAPAMPAPVAPNTVDTESSLSPGEEVVQSIENGNNAVKKVREREDRCEICELNRSATSSGSDSVGEQIYRRFQAKGPNENERTPPRRDDNPSTSVRSAMCGSRDGGYDVCITSGDTSPTSFKFTSPRGASSREWEFSFENFARQDIGFSISDLPASGSNSQTKESYLMVFPRKYLPSIKISGASQIVSLANGEVIQFDATTKKITGGVFSEDKKYSGDGVIVQADVTGGDPRYAKSKNTNATITKKGKTCSVPKKDLWPDQSQTSALHFKFSSDQDFENYLKKKCGFGL